MGDCKAISDRGRTESFPLGEGLRDPGSLHPEELRWRLADDIEHAFIPPHLEVEGDVLIVDELEELHVTARA
jgi:hypothetical protein